MDPNASVPIPQHDFPKFGSGNFTEQEKAQIQRLLEETIGVEDVLFREGPAGCMSQLSMFFNVILLICMG